MAYSSNLSNGAKSTEPAILGRRHGVSVLGLNLQFDAAVLNPLIRRIAGEVIAQLEADLAKLGDRLAFSEAEAAQLIGLREHQLRDVRLAGRIGFSRLTGRRIRYSRGDILRYLAENHFGPS